MSYLLPLGLLIRAFLVFACDFADRRARHHHHRNAGRRVVIAQCDVLIPVQASHRLYRAINFAGKAGN